TPAQRLASTVSAQETNPPAVRKTSKPVRKKGRPVAVPFKEGSGWCLRTRHKGHDIYLSGCLSALRGKCRLRWRCSRSGRQRWT
ncbi:MAG: hypothetical protein ABIQ90_00165, partial [Polaromonas sp.]